jgi:hypothetical protein
MGFFKSLFRTAIQTQVLKQRQASKSQHTVSRQQETSAEREIREKQKLANDIRAQARLQSQQLLKIVNDCAELVNTTVNPEVFFKRYNLMLEHLETLTGYECTGIFDKSPELPSEAFLRIESQFAYETNKFLDRSFENAKKHADTLKTESGKANAIKRYFDNMEEYIVYMSGESLEYFDKMKENN